MMLSTFVNLGFLKSVKLFSLQNCSLGIVSKDMKFAIYDDEKVAAYVSFVCHEKWREGGMLTEGHRVLSGMSFGVFRLF